MYYYDILHQHFLSVFFWFFFGFFGFFGFLEMEVEGTLHTTVGWEIQTCIEFHTRKHMCTIAPAAGA